VRLFPGFSQKGHHAVPDAVTAFAVIERCGNVRADKEKHRVGKNFVGQ
jgi:hypothetical protein